MQRATAASADDFLWDAGLDRAVLNAVSVADPQAQLNICLGKCAIEKTLFVAPDASETIVFRASGLRLQIALTGRSLLATPLALTFLVADDRHMLAQLRQLAIYEKLRHPPLSLRPLDKRIPRWIAQLRALDAHAAGASAREIARILFDHRNVDDEWRTGGESLRSMVRRLLADAHKNSDHGYRKFFK